MKKSRIESLQVLRALAFLEIFLGHCGVEFFSGSFGVSIFMVLSGFCMAVNYLPKADEIKLSPVAAFRGGISKVKRLYPLHLIMLAVLYVVVGMPSSENAMKALAADILLVKCWRVNPEQYYSYNGVAWYLSTYLFVCMASPYLMYLFAKVKKQVQMAAIAAAVAAVMLVSAYYVSVVQIPVGSAFAEWFTYISPVYRMLDFSLGAALGWFYLHGSTKCGSVRLWTILEILTVFGVIVFEHYYPAMQIRYAGISYTAFWTPLSLALVLVFAECRGKLSRFLQRKTLLWIGDLSAYTFLIHQVVIRWFTMNVRIPLPGKLPLLVVIAVCTTLTFSGAVLYLKISKKISAVRQTAR